MKPVKKVIRDGKVAVLVGGLSGWSTNNSLKHDNGNYNEEGSKHLKELLIFSNILVELVEKEDREILTNSSKIKELLGVDEEQYLSVEDGESLEIEWVPVNSFFHIEYDNDHGLEILITEEDFYRA